MQSAHTAGARHPGKFEAIVLMAFMSALHAFSIDAMLPALGQMGIELGFENDNNRQYIITSLFLGFAVGVLFFGFMSDRFGRRKPVIAGFLIFLVGTLLCTSSQSLTALLGGRVLQGVGSASPYVIAVAIVRDRYEGRDMAEIMSLIMMVFIGVPMIAPFIGQAIQLAAGWRAIFIALALFAIITLIWFYWRQPETLADNARQPLSLLTIRNGIISVFQHPVSFSNMLILGVISGAFITYLSTAQQVFHDIYHLGDKLPLTIAALASMYGLACFSNARLVQKIGMRALVSYALSAIVIGSVIGIIVMLVTGGNLPFAGFMVYMAIIVFCFGFLFENIVTLALDPMSHMAAAAMSIITSFSTLAGVAVSAVVGNMLENTVMPIVVGFAVLCFIAGAIHYIYTRQSNTIHQA